MQNDTMFFPHLFKIAVASATEITLSKQTSTHSILLTVALSVIISSS